MRHAALPGSGDDAKRDGNVVAAALLVHVGRGQVYYNFSARNMESHGLQGRYGPQKALFHCRVGKANEMYAYSSADFHLDSHRHGFDADAFRSMNINQHSQFFCPKTGKIIRN